MPIYVNPENGDVREIPSNSSAADLRRQYNIPDGRALARWTADGRIERSEQVNVEGIYVDLPDYKRGVNIHRIDVDILILDKVLFNGRHNIIISNDRSSLFVEGFYLPDGYSPDRSNILMLFPDDYPETPPGLSSRQGIYLTRGLEYNGRRLGCSNDYHSGCSCGDSQMVRTMAEKGWAWWCFARMAHWNPRRDGLLQVFTVLLETLQHPRA